MRAPLRVAITAVAVMFMACAGAQGPTDQAGKTPDATAAGAGSDRSVSPPAVSDAGGKPTGIIVAGGRTGADVDDSVSWVLSVEEGGNARHISFGGQDRDVSLSPDDRTVVFSCGALLRRAEICTMHIDGSGRKRLTRNWAEDRHPAMSVDGWIVFQRFVKGVGYEIFKMRSDGSDVIRLTDNHTDDEEPAWSPDGRRIIFSRHVGLTADGNDFDYDLFVMTSDGREPSRLTSGEEADRTADWSPDGRRIAFTRGDPWPDLGDLYSVRVDGSGVRLIARRAVDPAWSDDGEELLFFGTRNEEMGIFRIRANGKALRRLLGDHYGDGGCFPYESDGVCYYYSPDW